MDMYKIFFMTWIKMFNAKDVLEINTISYQTSKQLWYLWLGHIAKDRHNKLDRMGILSNQDFASLTTCESYLKGKMTWLFFVGQSGRAKAV